MTEEELLIEARKCWYRITPSKTKPRTRFHIDVKFGSSHTCSWDEMPNNSEETITTYIQKCIEENERFINVYQVPIN